MIVPSLPMSNSDYSKFIDSVMNHNDALSDTDNIITPSLFTEAYAAKFSLKINQRVFVPSDTLIVYGSGVAKDNLILSLFDPNGGTVRIDYVTVKDDGSFFKEFIYWPQPTKNLPFGQYTLRVVSSTQASNTEEIQLNFAPGLAQPTTAGEQHSLAVKLDSPTQVSTNSTFRIFVQVTFDGALVNSDDPDLLGSSHIHSGNQTINLNNKFTKLHEGIFYADVVLPNDATYIIHAIAFYKGYQSHDSKVVTASSSSIGTIQQSVNELNEKLRSANKDLAGLQQQLNKTDSTVQSAESTIRSAVEDTRKEISDNLNQVKDASGQINSLIIPVLALISIIIALQISLFARIRASYR